MMFTMKDQSTYFASRHIEETAAAEAATTPEARIAHLDLAMRYSLLAAQDSLAAGGTSGALSTASPPQ
jgi:hypothetical protein